MAGFGGGGFAPTGGPAGVQVRAQIDVRAMPHILRRIVTMAIKMDPWQVALAMGCALGAAVANLAVPRLFGHAVDQAVALLRTVSHGKAIHLSAVQQHLSESHATSSLVTTAAIV